MFILDFLINYFKVSRLSINQIILIKHVGNLKLNDSFKYSWKSYNDMQKIDLLYKLFLIENLISKFN